MEATDSCNAFVANPAQEHFTGGIVVRFEENPARAIEEHEAAIRLGLPEDDEMHARFFLGEAYLHSLHGRPVGEFGASREFDRALENMERAIVIDERGQYGLFAETVNRARLRTLDSGYALRARTIYDRDGADAAIAYLQNKLSLFNYLSSTPALNVLLTLGNYYGNDKHDNGQAAACYRRLLEADVVDPGDETENEAQTRQLARQTLRIVEEQPTTNAKCFIATTVYGENSEEVDIFRRFRDEVLCTRPWGRKLVAAYYQVGPRGAEVIGRSNAGRRAAKLILSPVARLLRRRAE